MCVDWQEGEDRGGTEEWKWEFCENSNSQTQEGFLQATPKDRSYGPLTFQGDSRVLDVDTPSGLCMATL